MLLSLYNIPHAPMFLLPPAQPLFIKVFITVLDPAIHQVADIDVVSDTSADMKTPHLLNIMMQKNII